MPVMYEKQVISEDDKFACYQYYARKSESEIRQAKKEIRNTLESNQELSSIDLESIENHLIEIEHAEEDQESRKAKSNPLTRGGVVDSSGMRIIETFTSAGVKQERKDFSNMDDIEIRSSAEYRSAWVKHMQGQEARMTEIEKRAFDTTGSSAAIPTTIHNEVMKKLEQVVALFPYITRTDLPGKVTIPVSKATSEAIWHKEFEDITPGNEEIEGVTLNGYELVKLIPVSAAASAMTVAQFESYITQQITDKMSISLEKATLYGAGPNPPEGTNPQPTGIFPGVTWAAGNTVTVSASQGMKYEDITAALAKLPSPYLPGAIWVMNTATLYGIVANISDAEGKSIFVTDVTKGMGTIMGRPVIVDDYIVGSDILLGNFKYYFLNFSEGIQLEKSRESGFRKATIDYRGLAVVDGKPAFSEPWVKITFTA